MKHIVTEILSIAKHFPVSLINLDYVFTYFFQIVTKCSEFDDVAPKKPCIDRKPLQLKPEAFPSQKTCCLSENSDTEELTIGEVTTVMRNLGTCYDPEGDKLQDTLCSNQITALFEQEEPSLQEVREAFSLFDENNDGFIDSNELKKVLSVLSFAAASDAECRRMINAFDTNGDGVIDFQEFVRLVAKSFS